ncbi:hypothetical protein PTTG_29810 [Puccinia triticina 1-1 BBBD Race 1]|uniref:Uncharacterized protein n=1 Tax=Puccinia triticina (isolate 1-1 / race 1 (BBBD)) TaxID=630390 RepID=A0A180G2E8_PUCT1|nr:hypothetical protein PTTG_29810 [Puccinia triticina 1-1 BBBD Race 1]
MHFGRDILLLSILTLIVLIGELSCLEGSPRDFSWVPHTPELDATFRPPASSAAAATEHDDYGQPFPADHFHRFPAQVAAGEHPADSLAYRQEIPFDFHEIHGSGFVGGEPRTSELDLDAIFRPPGTSAAAATGQADHGHPFSADDFRPIHFPAGPSCDHNYLPPEYYPTTTAAEEHSAKPLVQDVPDEFAETFQSAFGGAQNFADLLKLLAGGTTGPDGLVAAGASQAHSGVPHLLDSRNHPIAGPSTSYVPAVSENTSPSSSTFGPDRTRKQRADLLANNHKPEPRRVSSQKNPQRGRTHLHTSFPLPDVSHVLDNQSNTIADPGPSHVPALPGYPFPASSDRTPALNQRPSRKRKQNVKPLAESLKPQPPHVNNQTKRRRPPTTLVIPLPDSQRPDLSERLIRQGGLAFYLTDFAPNDPSDEIQKIEVGRIVKQLKLDAIPNNQLVIPEDDFLRKHRLYLGFVKPPRSVTALAIKPPGYVKGSSKPPGSFLSRSDNKVQEHPYTRVRRLSEKLHDFAPHYLHWYQHWFDETGIDFEKNLLQPHFISFQDAGVLFPLYLFYVEMISSIVPRNKEVTLEDELYWAQNFFNEWTKICNDPKYQTDPRFKKTIELFIRQRKRPGPKKILPLLWSYLELWMKTHRNGIFEKKSRAISKVVKEFFNNVFTYAYSAQHERYIARIITQNPGKIGMLN